MYGIVYLYNYIQKNMLYKNLAHDSSCTTNVNIEILWHQSSRCHHTLDFNLTSPASRRHRREGKVPSCLMNGPYFQVHNSWMLWTDFTNLWTKSWNGEGGPNRQMVYLESDSLWGSWRSLSNWWSIFSIILCWKFAAVGLEWTEAWVSPKAKWSKQGRRQELSLYLVSDLHAATTPWA